MIGEDVGVGWVEHCVFHWLIQQSFGVTDQVGVHRIICADQHHQGALASAASPPRLLAEAGDGTGEAADHHRVQAAYVDAQFQGVGAGQAQQFAFVELSFQSAAILRGIARTISGDALRIQRSAHGAELLGSTHRHGFRTAPGSGEREGTRAGGDDAPHDFRGFRGGRAANGCAVLTCHVVQKTGFPEGDGSLAQGGAILGDRGHLGTAGQSVRMGGGIHAGGGSEDHHGRVFHQAEESAQHQCHMRAEDPAVDVAFVDNHVFQGAQ